ncbi:MAG: hypothetical protein R3E42_14875 [Burkholderiaceae bacterium]
MHIKKSNVIGGAINQIALCQQSITIENVHTCCGRLLAALNQVLCLERSDLLADALADQPRDSNKEIECQHQRKSPTPTTIQSSRREQANAVMAAVERLRV